MVNYSLFTNIIIYDLMDNNIGKLHFICAFYCFSQSLLAYTGTVILKNLNYSMLSQRFTLWPKHANLNVYITVLSLSGPPINPTMQSAWFVLVFDVIMQWVYSRIGIDHQLQFRN